MGVEYSPKDLLLGLNEASSNRIGSPVDNILTYCYHYDPQTNKHSLIVARVVQLGGLMTLLLLGWIHGADVSQRLPPGALTGKAGAGERTKVNG